MEEEEKYETRYSYRKAISIYTIIVHYFSIKPNIINASQDFITNIYYYKSMYFIKKWFTRGTRYGTRFNGLDKVVKYKIENKK